MILNHTNEKIVKIVRRIGNSTMTASSHGNDKYPGWKIIDAARDQAKTYKDLGKENPAVSLMMVVLAANRNYNRAVAPHVKRLRNDYPDLTFKKLQNMLEKHDYREFGTIWGHEDEKKYCTLKMLVEAIIKMKKSIPGSNDWGVMHHWASNSNLNSRKSDSIGCIRNVGIATFQHLRMVFGIDTVKPDQRVIEVLERKFGTKLSPLNAILAVEEIARVTGHRVIEIDQIFVKYGSGYPNKEGVTED